MNIAQNLQFLRKRDKITQEALADKLDVSRQAVSKWETGEAYPETDKLLAICDLFDVSLDKLMREDMSIEPQDSTPTEAVKKTAATEYFNHVDKLSRAVSIGVALIIIGAAICVALAGASLTLAKSYADLTVAMSGTAAAIFAVPAIFLFIYNGINHDRFKRAHPIVERAGDDDNVSEFAKRFTLAVALLVSAILLDATIFITLTVLLQSGIIPAADKASAQCMIVSGFLAALAFIVGGLTYYGIQHGKYNVDGYNDKVRAMLNPTKFEKLCGAICGAIMTVSLSLFFIFEFAFENLDNSWIAILVGGLLCGIAVTILKAIDGNKK